MGAFDDNTAVSMILPCTHPACDECMSRMLATTGCVCHVCRGEIGGVVSGSANARGGGKKEEDKPQAKEDKKKRKRSGGRSGSSSGNGGGGGRRRRRRTTITTTTTMIYLTDVPNEVGRFESMVDEAFHMLDMSREVFDREMMELMRASLVVHSELDQFGGLRM